MPQPKIYKDNAQRQAAYRRRKGPKSVTKAALAQLAHGLNVVLNDAVEYSTLPLPNELVDVRTEVTLRNLIRFFNQIYDPVTNPNGKIHRKPRYFELEQPRTDRIKWTNKP
jgi:hypothetical protein